MAKKSVWKNEYKVHECIGAKGVQAVLDTIEVGWNLHVLIFAGNHTDSLFGDIVNRYLLTLSRTMQIEVDA